MIRPASIRQPVFVSLTLAGIAAAWWGCTPAAQPPAGTRESTSSGSSSTGGTGGMGVTIDGGVEGGSDGSIDDGGACVSKSEAAAHIHVDIVFLIDQSGSMSGPKWMGTTSALTKFFNDPASAGIGAGIVYFPNNKTNACVPTDYAGLDVPIDVLPANAFALTNSMPADATGTSTPMYGALQGALMAATAYQDAHPTHKVILVLATDGDPNGCALMSIPEVAGLAASARNYNGVLTYVIGCQGSTIANLDQIAAAGGTTAAYDITNDISQFSAKIADIRQVALGCAFEIPPPPGNMQLDPDQVNFSYTPNGMGMPTVLLRAKDVAGCSGDPGWYYDNDTTPTRILLCPASCTTVQADENAKVNVLFGCKSIYK
jgi:hypothetical protein